MPNRYAFTWIASCLTAFVSAASPHPACAQLSPGATRDLTAPAEQLEVKPLPGIQLQAPPAPTPPVSADGTVAVSRFRFEGNTAVTAAELDAVVAPWIGRPLS